MITRKQLTIAEKDHFKALMVKVILWAEINVPNEYLYNSRAAYWGSALRAKIITQDEYQLGQDHYQNLWNYVGD
jgi:hypothetical protein